jgi:hypothetical protein
MGEETEKSEKQEVKKEMWQKLLMFLGIPASQCLFCSYWSECWGKAV